jgi:ATP-dependent protease ClpP protease subunit
MARTGIIISKHRGIRDMGIGQHPQRSFLFGMVIVCLVTLLGVRTTRADVLVLFDGRTFFGEVVEENADSVSIRCQMETGWITLTFARRQIDLLEKEPGDQSDQAVNEDDAPPDDAPQAAPDEPVVDGKHTAMVIPLHGKVGGMVNRSATGTFSAGYVRQCLETAVNDGLEVVILEIESPGGLVVEMEAICETIIEYHDRLYIVAYPQEAYSAAAIITMSCRHIVVHPDSQFGAAVMIRGGGAGGPSAVDAKFASPHYARQRRYMQASGQPYEVIQAMTIQPIELWWNEKEGFTTENPNIDPAPENEWGVSDNIDWELLDSDSTILTITADEALRWRLAEFEASSPDDLVRQLDHRDIRAIRRMDEALRDYNRDLSRELSRIEDDLSDYFGGLSGILNGMNAFAAAFVENDEDVMKDARAFINRHRRQAITSGKRILNADKDLLARRFELTDVVAQRIEEDRRLIDRVSGLLRGNSAEGFVAAAERMNEVIAGWRELLGYE